MRWEMKRIRINIESSSKTVEEKIAVYLEDKEAVSYADLLRKTWPKTKVEIQNVMERKLIA